MKNKNVAQLFVLIMMPTLSSLSFAEYYSSYSSTTNGSCFDCQFLPSNQSHHSALKATHKKVAKRRHSAELEVYYPVVQAIPACECKDLWTNRSCDCCQNHSLVHSEYGDYAVFSSRPNNGYEKAHLMRNSYNDDMTTMDDRFSDMEIN
ncbi:MAG TPA: hypothetical protein VHA13_03015 [Gammaproteobacteria bacterium]|nr:hypothetical protein [Gammaproteobacteria bacterium]